MIQRSLILAILFVILTTIAPVYAQLEQDLPEIISFTTDTTAITLEEVENGTVQAAFSWITNNVTDDYEVRLYAYEINTWVNVQTEDEDPLEPIGSYELTVRHPLNFNPPTYRLIITDEQLITYSEAVVTIPYDTEGLVIQPAIQSFEVTEASLDANLLAYGEPRLNVAWSVIDRSPTSNLRFEQLLPNGQIVSVELSRRNLWVNSSGSGTLQPVLPESGDIVVQLTLNDLVSGARLDAVEQRVAVTGTLSTPTPRPTNPPPPTQAPVQPEQPEQPAPEENAPPVVAPNSGGGFELGGHVANFARPDIVNAAGMTWVKKQVRWNRGEGTGNASAIINGARANGHKILLGIVGYRDQMGDFEAYTNEFANYLGQVAALGPDAIEVWNEPNIDREWPAGTISGANYTVMLSKAYNAIKAANPNVMVISGAPAPTGFFGGSCAAGGCDDNVFLRQMAAAGAQNYMDCIGVHYNEGIISPDQSSGDPRGNHYSRYFTAMLNLYYNTFGGARQVCWTELGYLTPEGYPPLPGNFAWAQNTNLTQHAEWLGRAAALSRQSGRVRLMIVWNIDFTVYDSDPQAGYAILRPDGGCPACATLSAAVR